MSPPRRRRRRRGRGVAPEAAKRAEGQPQSEPGRDGGTRTRSRGRRRGRGATGRRSGSPLLSEDLVRALPKERPATLSGPPDGQTLEALIGDLQSEWGVPQYPQEYRITIKVADERDVRPDRPVTTAEPNGQSSDTSPAPGAPKRERAPAAPRVAATGSVEREVAPKRRRGRRRRRRGKDPEAGSTGSASTDETRPQTAEGPPPEA
jgi:hypothetical protein